MNNESNLQRRVPDEPGANAITGARYDATEIAGGATGVLAYGTAVVVVPVEADGLYNS